MIEPLLLIMTGVFEPERVLVFMVKYPYPAQVRACVCVLGASVVSPNNWRKSFCALNDFFAIEFSSDLLSFFSFLVAYSGSYIYRCRIEQ